MNEGVRIINEEMQTNENKKTYGTEERLLLPAALITAVLFDRLVLWRFFGRLFTDFDNLRMTSAVFWLCCLALFFAFYWKRLKRDWVAWFAGACIAALCIWNFVFTTGNEEFGIITFLVIPAVIMAVVQWSAGGFTPKNSEGMVLAWLQGWVVKPFTGMPAFFGTIGSLLSKGGGSVIVRAVIGVVIMLGLLVVIFPLLMGADGVFNYYVTRIFSNFDIFSLAGHTIMTAFFLLIFYSVFWNAGFGCNEPQLISTNRTVDIVISSVVLGGVTAVYVLFCIIQFTYLFAQAGLPAGMTYAEYAREGFAQTVAVCAINLLIFGAFLRFGTRSKLLTTLLGGLLTLTGIMLISGAMRLHLYIDAYGITWLRLLSAWFIVYLAAVIILCAVRLFKSRLPVLLISALLLLVWYVVLGFINPDGFVTWFNYDFFPSRYFSQ